MKEETFLVSSFRVHLRKQKQISMRKIVFGILVVLATAAGGAELELDTDLMHSIEDTNKSLASNIALKDAKAATSDSNDLNNMFDQVQIFFVQKGDAENAVDLAKKSKELTSDIIKAINANDYDSATNAATALSRNCRTCHTFYKKD
jgi:hypothetical protein